ncbi:[FeFe] hydrogenase H-cluster radical SAM maturase HydG [Wolinella succinogenes]|uniref:[FeFe] hydrogenase H-cluster radical SAM maturase HydG n=1 Tax=Wolinella succinogenes TaxID=844 RepID=UPI002409FEE3|nr:[FeFe] hydrogenase H-cluster radical SAM maturase HydG [Wolinella succinogenes]
MSWTKERFDRIKAWEESCEFEDFIDDRVIHGILKKQENPSRESVLGVINKAKENAYKGTMLTPEETAILLHIKDEDLWEEVFKAATFIKEEVYGNRIVLFSPLYISNPCVNNCSYCGFKSSNEEMSKKTLQDEELVQEIEALLDSGQKRLIAVYGEHPKSDYAYIAKTVKTIYSVKKDKTEIRRVNINAAPMFEEEYQAIKAEGIGTYQVFQETYHRETYEKIHPQGTLKGEYKWRLFALHRALKAGLDDVAIGVLFGLYDWKFEVLSMLYHAMDLERIFGIGPHTISFPRIKLTSGSNPKELPYALKDEDLIRIAAVVRLMCPFTGTILTAREEPQLRDVMLKKCGISQTDAGTNIGIGGYSKAQEGNDLSNQQFAIGDHRNIDNFILNLVREGRLPSFCTSCYREGRTGCNFMPLAKQATIKYLCIPNGILTFKEYIRDYASPEVKKLGEEVIIPKYLGMLRENLPQAAKVVEEMIQKLESGGTDCHL